MSKWVVCLSRVVATSWVFAALPGSLAQENRPDVEPEAVGIIHRFSEHARGMRHAEIVVQDTIDVALEDGQMVQCAHRRTALISRPNRLVLQSRGDVANRDLWKDGRTVTLYDADHQVYAQAKDPGTLDQMFEMLFEEFGLSLPLADLLAADPEEVLLKRARSGRYLGLHLAGDRECHHVLFKEDNIDWQAWIDAGEVPALRKLVVTYKNSPGSPQYIMHVVSVTPIVNPDDSRFRFTPPEGAERIKFHPVGASPEPGEAP